MTRRRSGTLVVASPALLAAGCGSSGQNPSVTGSSSSASNPSLHELVTAAYKYAVCMRNHGISDFPDPNTQGQLTLQTVQAAGVVLHTHATRTAGPACVSASNGAITAAAVEQATGGGQ